ncbi:MAG: hypothetical protein EHM41_23095 [Chloroflexi bacterium]|nr:MAG: hypothetical protein EHM41_23095 [Chloroflexota bacterium]
MSNTYLSRMLSENEKILLTTRQHWFLFLSSIMVELLATLIIIAIAALVTIFFPPIAWIGIAVAVVLILVPFIGGVHDFLVWWNRQYIITNRRIVHISGVINKRVTDTSLEKLNDVKMEQTALGRMFNYGDVEILTASELGVDKFRFLADPIQFKTAMLNAKQRLEDNRGVDVDNIPTLIERLDNLRKHGVITETEFQEKKAKLLSRVE